MLVLRWEVTASTPRTNTTEQKPSAKCVSQLCQNLTFAFNSIRSIEPCLTDNFVLQQDDERSKKMMKGGAFRLNMHSVDYFDTNPYKSDKPLPPVKSSSGTKKNLQPFRPTHPGRKVRAHFTPHACSATVRSSRRTRVVQNAHVVHVQFSAGRYARRNI